jgi:hypothetical protein
MEYTKRRNLNRGYMKLEVWHRGMDLFDTRHYEVENKLLALIGSLKSKREDHTWQDKLPQSQQSTNPLIH